MGPNGPDSSEAIDVVMAPVRQMLSRLMRSAALESGDIDAALAQLTEAASIGLDVERSSVWLFDEAHTELRLLDLYERKADRHTSGAILRASETPFYFAALAEERTIAAHDARRDPRTSEFEKKYLAPNGITAMLDAPIRLDGKLVGVVCNEHVGGARRWLPWQELVAGTFGDFVSIVLGAAERARQARALELYRQKLEEIVAERTRQLRESEERFHMLFDAAPVAIVFSQIPTNAVIAANSHASAMFGVPLDEVEGHDATHFWVDPDDRAKMVAALREGGQIDSFEARLKTRSGASFWADIAARVIRQDDGVRTLLLGIRDVSHQKEVEERLRRLATTDELTGALNRRRIFEVAGEESERANRYERPLSLAMLDLDHFKTVNDRFGHVIGDEALRLVMSTVRGILRRQDSVGRYGGEEFVLVLPETSSEAASVVVERARVAVEALILEHRGTRVALTMSAGIVTLRPDEDLPQLFARADAAVYEAKRRGRNCVVVVP